MDKWEYKCHRTSEDRDDNEIVQEIKMMNNSGEQGWELVSTIKTQDSPQLDKIEFWFKRKIN